MKPRRLVVGAVVTLAAAIALYSRFSEDDTLSRDESLYSYAGQQFAEGVPFYSSLFEQKTPLAAILSGLATVVGRWLGAYDVHAQRWLFFALGCLTVVAVYLLGAWLWESVAAGAVAAATFVGFAGFAEDALGGPDAKTPGILFAVASMALLVRRRWFWGAFAASLAFLVWQPLLVYVAVALVAGRQQWRRVLLGLAIPVVAVCVYFLATGAFARMIDAAFLFPATGLQRPHETFSEHFTLIGTTVHDHYGLRGDILVAGGLVALCALYAAGRARCAVVVLGSLLPLLAFSLYDFQGYPDVFPLLPYAALGVGGLVTLLRGRAQTAAATAVAVALVALAAVDYMGSRASDSDLVVQRARAAKLERIIGDGTLYSFMDPRPLVLTGRRNPSRFVYVGEGVDKWVVDGTPGGFEGWRRRIAGYHADVVFMGPGWDSGYAESMKAWLRSAYERRFLDDWRLFLTPDAAARGGSALSLAPPPA